MVVLIDGPSSIALGLFPISRLEGRSGRATSRSSECTCTCTWGRESVHAIAHVYKNMNCMSGVGEYTGLIGVNSHCKCQSRHLGHTAVQYACTPYASLLRVYGHGYTNYGSSIEAKICMAFEISAAFLLSDEIRADGLTSSILVT